MNGRLTRILVALPALAAWSLLATVGCEQNTGQPSALAEPPAADAEASSGQAPAEAAGDGAKATPEDREHITGAFGLTLGERFLPAMVAEVLGEEPQSYMKADRSQGQGTRFNVVPTIPDEHYNAYAVATNEAGMIYMIEGEFTPAEKASRCERARTLVDELAAKYGATTAASIDGTTYSFSNNEKSPSRNVTLFNNRCTLGYYRIVYYDHSLLWGDTAQDAAAEAKD